MVDFKWRAQYQGVGKSGVTFLPVPRGPLFPLRLADRSCIASQIVVPGEISNGDPILLGWVSAGHLVYAEKEAQRHLARCVWRLGEVTAGEKREPVGTAEAAV